MSTPFAALGALLFLSAAPVALAFQAAPDGVVPDAVVRVDPAVVSPAERAKILRRAAAAMETVKSASGDFTQVAPDYSVSSGTYALRRPGRVRFAYNDPTPILIVADGTTVAIEDRELESVDRVPLASTPLALLLSNSLDFEGKAEVTNVQVSDGIAAISMTDRSGEAEGELTLIFDAETFELLAWRTEDATGGITSVQLANTKTNVTLDPRLFRLADAEDPRDDDRR